MHQLRSSPLSQLFLLTSLTTVSGTFLHYGRTRLNGSLPNVTLTVGGRETVYCLRFPLGPKPTAIEWYNPQGQLVSRDGGDEVNLAVITRGWVYLAALTFQNYKQSQGGRYECRVTGPGNNSKKLSVCIGECYMYLGQLQIMYKAGQGLNLPDEQGSFSFVLYSGESLCPWTITTILVY